jgi:hypothetical protein
MTNRFQEELMRAAEELGLIIVVNYVVVLPKGDSFLSQTLFPNPGNLRGTLVFSSNNKVDATTRSALSILGYSMSSFAEPLPNQIFDIESCREMFADWGWVGDEQSKPKWMD